MGPLTLRLFIDPGAHHLACAHFEELQLLSVEYLPREAFLDGSTAAVGLAELVIEKPQIYGGPDSKDPNDCVDVAMAAAFAEAAIRGRGGPPAQYVLPRAWKGQMKKPPHHLAIWRTLRPPEKAIFARDADKHIFRTKVESKMLLEDFVSAKIERGCELLARTGKVKEYSWKAHNLLDAVGLGLWHLGRTGRAGQRYMA